MIEAPAVKSTTITSFEQLFDRISDDLQLETADALPPKHDYVWQMVMKSNFYLAELVTCADDEAYLRMQRPGDTTQLIVSCNKDKFQSTLTLPSTTLGAMHRPSDLALNEHELMLARTFYRTARTLNTKDIYKGPGIWHPLDVEIEPKTLAHITGALVRYLLPA